MQIYKQIVKCYKNLRLYIVGFYGKLLLVFLWFWQHVTLVNGQVSVLQEHLEIKVIESEAEIILHPNRNNSGEHSHGTKWSQDADS